MGGPYLLHGREHHHGWELRKTLRKQICLIVHLWQVRKALHFKQAQGLSSNCAWKCPWLSLKNPPEPKDNGLSQAPTRSESPYAELQILRLSWRRRLVHCPLWLQLKSSKEDLPRSDKAQRGGQNPPFLFLPSWKQTWSSASRQHHRLLGLLG